QCSNGTVQCDELATPSAGKISKDVFLKEVAPLIPPPLLADVINHSQPSFPMCM
ncbi:hypothetical protein P7K49_019980, partial [Saguinus oedipus]